VPRNEADDPKRADGPVCTQSPQSDFGASAAAGPESGPAGRAACLRVGVMLDGWTDRAWVAKIIEDIQTSGVAQVVTVVINQGTSPSRRRSLHKLLPNLLFAVYHRLDRWIFRRLLNIRRDAFAEIDLRPLVGDCNVRDVVPQRQQFTDRFDPASVEWLRQQQLDVMLRFGFRIIRGPILETARYGVWSFHHGDNREYRGTPPMFWEMYEGNPVCGVTLQILTDQLDGGKVIYRSIEKTNFFSLYLNRNRNYWKATESVVQRLRQLHAGGWSALGELDTYLEEVPYSKKIYRSPGNLVMLNFLMHVGVRAVRRVFLDLLTEEQWSVAWRRRARPLFVEPTTSEEPFRLLRPPRGFFFADPFSIEYQGRYFIFFEDCEYACMRAVISWIELDAEGNPSEPRVALSADCHLSYPCVFEHDGQIYMIPETRERRRIELYRADSFPDRWTLDRVLIDGISAVDATWLHYHGRYWLFAAAAIEGASDALHIFSSAAPFGPWRPHRGNPVVTTIRGARPAGRLFIHNGQLIRPGQDGAKAYGHHVNLYRVDQLDDEGYRETQIGTIEPEWLPGNLGTHTYGFDERFEVLDGRVRIMRGLRLRRRPNLAV
jgi:methionyl-tRNA formyltransferase